MASEFSVDLEIAKVSTKDSHVGFVEESFSLIPGGNHPQCTIGLHFIKDIILDNVL